MMRPADTTVSFSESEKTSYSQLRRPYFDPIRIEGDTIVDGIMDALPYLHGVLLDVGCGTMPYSHLLKDRVSRHVGSDLHIHPDKPPTVCADTLSLPFKDNSFDSVLCTQVLEHVKNPFMMMAEINRVLRVGGHAVLTMPAAWPLHEEPHDYFRYTKYGLEELARVNGLQVVSVRERGGGISAIGQLIGAMLYDRFGNRVITRIPMKLFFAPFISLFKFFDKLFYYPKFTLGYVLIVQKSVRSINS